MSPGCVQCGGAASAGLLCDPCATALVCADRLLPEHIVSKVAAERAEAWLVDRWGRPHGVAANKTTVGRASDSAVALFDESVSREHAVVRRRGDEWVVRDLGSKNSTRVGDSRVEGRAPLSDGVDVCFGEVAFYFRETDAQLCVSASPTVSTADAQLQSFRLGLSEAGSDTEVLLLARSDKSSDAEASIGQASFRRGGVGGWTELPLTPMELRLLVALCQAKLGGDLSVGDKGTVSAKQLARALPFKTRYASDENVRQLVKRLRVSLADAGIEGLVDAVRHRGYFVTWQVSNKPAQ